jgi:glc operon protein GlcG
MTRPQLLTALVFAAMGVFAPLRPLAQTARPAQTAPPAQPQAPRPMGIDLVTAKKMATVAEAAAAAAGFRVSIAIVDANGDLAYFERMDGASLRAVTSSLGKARAALLFGVPTKEIQDAMADGKPVSVRLTAPAAWAWEVLPQQGGLPILKDGKVVAAIGIGGAQPSANDEKFAQAAIDAVK